MLWLAAIGVSLLWALGRYALVLLLRDLREKREMKRESEYWPGSYVPWYPWGAVQPWPRPQWPHENTWTWRQGR